MELRVKYRKALYGLALVEGVMNVGMKHGRLETKDMFSGAVASQLKICRRMKAEYRAAQLRLEALQNTNPAPTLDKRIDSCYN